VASLVWMTNFMELELRVFVNKFEHIPVNKIRQNV